MEDRAMIERVARAIYETEPYGIAANKAMPWSDVHESQKEGFLIKARAAIEAMPDPRPPTSPGRTA